MPDEPNDTRAASSRVRARSVAEVVASRLRDRIVRGELADGDLLPKQEQLLTEFGVSKPSVREALRILEAEGLVSVRRGKIGGAVVHRPRVDNAAYVLELVLRAQSVSVEDIAEAIRQIEPVCAALCASRPDRAEAVLPRLREAHEKAGAHLDDVRLYTRLARRFHEELVACSGNQTMILVVGALEAVLSAHAAVWADERTDGDGSPVLDHTFRHNGQQDHELILRLIERGESETASREARQHLGRAPVYRTVETVEIMPELLGSGETAR